MNERNAATSRPNAAASYPAGAPPIAANVGSFMNSVAAIVAPERERVKSSSACA